MNERIKQLAEQAELPLIDVDGRCKYGDTYFDKEKFAELIVRECAEVAGCNGHVSGFALGDLIKKHFGVEE